LPSAPEGGVLLGQQSCQFLIVEADKVEIEVLLLESRKFQP
jgi:hypothetical protein